MSSFLFQGAFLRYNLIMSYKYSVIKDNPIGFWFLDDQSGTTAIDISGCGNNGTYSQALSNFPLPLTYGGNNSVEISTSQAITFPLEYNYSGISSGTPIANKNYSYNEFSIEFFMYPKDLSSTLEPIVADTSAGIGVFANDKGVVFAINGLTDFNYRLDYNVPNFKKVIHVVCVYSISSMSIYVDGVQEAIKEVDGFTFLNNSLLLKSGPASSGNKFLIDSVAVYRYALDSNQILNHYGLAQSIPAFNIVNLDRANLFNIYDTNISTIFEYSYPARKSWNDMLSPGLEFNIIKNRIQIPLGSGVSQSANFQEVHYIPSSYGANSSKIEWSATNGVSVFTSVDGVNYLQCENGYKIPQYGNSLAGETFDQSYRLFIKVLFETNNDRVHCPSMESLTIKFYKDQKLYSTVSSSYISQIIDDSDYSPNAFIGDKQYPLLARNAYDGISSKEDSGFYLNMSSPCNTLEFFYTPISLVQSGLIYRPEIVIEDLSGGLYNTSYTGLDVVDGGLYNSSYTQSYDAGTVPLDIGVSYLWSEEGEISKSNIKKIYVNGVDKTLETDISEVFAPGEMSHVVIFFENTITNQVKMNYSPDGSNESRYQYISTYGYEIGEELVLDHYETYINGSPTLVVEPSFSMTENSVEVYDNDWIVIQNV